MHLDHDEFRREGIELGALKPVGIRLLVMAVYIAGESVSSLVRQDSPERSLPGIAMAIAAPVTMPGLAWAKRKVASAMGSSALQADSRQADICAYLSAILLLNAALDWWWADPAAGLAMVPLIAYEGAQALRGKKCCRDCD